MRQNVDISEPFHLAHIRPRSHAPQDQASLTSIPSNNVPARLGTMIYIPCMSFYLAALPVQISRDGYR